MGRMVSLLLVAIAGLGLMVSAFVEAPLVSLSLSFFLGIVGEHVRVKFQLVVLLIS